MGMGMGMGMDEGTGIRTKETDSNTYSEVPQVPVAVPATCLLNSGQ